MRDIEWVDFRLSLENQESKPVDVEGFRIPSRFGIEYLLKDQRPRSVKLWRARLIVEFNADNVPRALQVTTHGFTHVKKKGIIESLTKSEPVERWQLEAVETNLSTLIALAVTISAQSLTYSEEMAQIRREIQEKTRKGDADQTPSSGGYINYDDLDLYPLWIHNNKSKPAVFDSGIEWEIDAVTIEKIRENIKSRTRRRTWSDSHLREVARIHREERQRAESEKRRAKTVEAVADYFGAENRTVDYWIKEARERGFLEPVARPKNFTPSEKAGKL